MGRRLAGQLQDSTSWSLDATAWSLDWFRCRHEHASSCFQMIFLKDNPLSPILDHFQCAFCCREFHLCSRTPTAIDKILWQNIWKTQQKESGNMQAENNTHSASPTQGHKNPSPLFFQIIPRTDIIWEQNYTWRSFFHSISETFT